MSSPSESSKKQILAEHDSSAQFFRSASEFREWLRRNHAKASAILVGFRKKKSGKPGISYDEAHDKALCYGWIDGVRKAIDEDRR